MFWYATLGLCATNGITCLLVYVYKNKRDKAVLALDVEKAKTADREARIKELEGAVEVAKKSVDDALLRVADVSKRSEDVSSAMKKEIAALEKDLESCKTPDALRARLNNLNGMFQLPKDK